MFSDASAVNTTISAIAATVNNANAKANFVFMEPPVVRTKPTLRQKSRRDQREAFLKALRIKVAANCGAHRRWGQDSQSELEPQREPTLPTAAVRDRRSLLLVHVSLNRPYSTRLRRDERRGRMFLNWLVGYSN